MKRILIGAIALVLAAGAVSCSSSKKAVGPAAPAGMVEEAIPLSGPQYRSDAEYYRAVQNGVSTERSTAQKIAMQNCRQDLAAAIPADVKTVIENYVKNQDTVTKILDMVPDFVNKFTGGKKESSPVADAIQDAVDVIEKEEADV